MKTCILMLSAVLAASALAEKQKADTAPAIAAAKSWLKLVDAGKYVDSHASAAAFFRNAVTVEQWTKAGSAARRPLGATKSRKVQSAVFMTELPGAPDGEYVVIQFATSFANKKTAIETVTPMKEKDGSWKVSGYYIK